MPLPVTFATLPQGNQPAALLDTQFAALGVLVHIPCTAVGQNAVLLTVANNTPFTSTYTNLSPAFVWVQQQTSTGNVTLGVAGGPATLQAYRNNGQTAIGSGDLVAGAAYSAFYVSTLNSGAGGWVVDAFVTGGGGSGTGALKTVTAYSGSQTITIPASVSQARVKMWGATGASGASSGAAVSGGTGAGGYAESLFTGLTPGNTIIYTQGGAGAGGAGDGGSGGTTTLATGTQTITTITCNGSAGSKVASTNQLGTAGATATGGNVVNLTGQSGAPALVVGSAPPGGRNFYSIGADGQGSGNGNNGMPGGIIIEWYT